MGFIDGAGSQHQTPVAVLSALLLDPRFHPADQLTPNEVGNFAVYRGNFYVGYIDLGADEVVFFDVAEPRS